MTVWLSLQKNFVDRHDLLLARFVTPCIGGRSVIPLLNHTMQPVTMYAHEALGSFFYQQMKCALHNPVMKLSYCITWQVVKRKLGTGIIP